MVCHLYFRFLIILDLTVSDLSSLSIFPDMERVVHGFWYSIIDTTGSILPKAYVRPQSNLCH